ncbi:MAG: alpha/beta fold hydrolase [Cognatishimia sp.]|uniref:alpha/beta fold hydrolase n=1 Tax=Cognatishimia sp. TaxID=2211648 RepID=UPI003B8BB724
MKNLVLLASIASLAVSVTTVSAQDASGFRTEGEGDWYHPIEIEEWVSLGAEETKIKETLSAIADTVGKREDPEQPDTLMAYGPGHWTYEWEQLGDEALETAHTNQSMASAQAARVYFHLASAPHTNDPNQRRALAKASEAYLLAASLTPYSVIDQEITATEGTFQSFVHLPAGNGPFPVVVASQGSDQSKEMLLEYFLDYLAPRGIALVSLDLPGMGGSANFDFADGKSDKLHLAAIQWIKTQDGFAHDNIFVQGASFGGHAAARVFTQADTLGLAGVMSFCAPLDAPFKAPPSAYEALPAFTIDGVRARINVAPDASMRSFARAIRPVALSNSDLLDGPEINTPILVLTTNQDPVAPLEDVDALLNRATNSTRIVLDEPGHCPEGDIEDRVAASWIVDNLRGDHKKIAFDDN